MKTIFTIVAAMLIWSTSAQNFYLLPNDSLQKIIVTYDMSDLNIDIIRGGVTDTVWLDYELITNTLPEEWYAGYCDNHGCWGSLPENGSMSAMYDEQNSFIKLSINPQYVEGSGIVQYYVYEQDDYENGQMMTFIVETPDFVGLLETPDMTISIYPNPIVNIVYISTNKTINAVNIYNITGKTVLKNKVNSSYMQLNTSELESGIYLLEVIDEYGNKQTRRLVK